MKAITLTQPWATLVAIGAKRIETRSWPTEFRGEFAIHAAKGFPDDARYIVGEEPFQSVLAAALNLPLVLATELPTASIIAVATLDDCWRFTERTESQIRHRSGEGDLPPFEADFGDYAAGRYGFYLPRARQLSKPVPARGMLSLWNMPADVERAVREQLEAA
jgi:hypothetical protein